MRFRKLAKPEGLSNNTVFSIVQDDEGFMWFGTRGGLNRYDGYRFEAFQHPKGQDSSFFSNDIRHIYFDKKDTSIWIGTRRGLSNYLKKSNQFVNYKLLQNAQITSIVRDSKGRLWIGSSAGLFVSDNRDNIEFKKDKSIGENEVYCIFEESDEKIWVATSAGLYILPPGAEANTYRKAVNPHQLNTLSELLINGILEDFAGDLWFSTQRSGLFKWIKSNNIVKKFNYDENDDTSLSSNNTMSMSLDRKGRVWVGTLDGLNVFNSEESGFTRILNNGLQNEGLNNNSIRSIFFDRNDGMWVGTYYRGINYADESFNRFKTVLPFPGISNDDRNIISALSTDNIGNIWIGTEGKGFGYWNPENKQFKFVDKNKILNTANIKVIHPDGAYLWIGTYTDGLVKYHLESGGSQYFLRNTENPNSLKSNNVYSIYKKGSTTWFATFGGGLSMIHEGSSDFITYTHHPNNIHSISSDGCRLIVEDPDKNLWVGTNNGLNKILGTESGQISFERYLPGVIIYALMSNKRNEIWIGTPNKGLYRLDIRNNQIENFTVEDGLPGNTVYSIQSDKDGNLWLSTNNGLARFQTHTKSFINYDHSTEKGSLQFSVNASCVLGDSLFLFGSNNGFVYFNPSEIKVAEYKPSLVFSKVRLLGADHSSKKFSPFLNNGDNILLDYERSNIEIQFSSLDFSSPAKNKYAYKMQGIDDEWIYTVGKPEAVYTLQREGNYIFEYKASNSDGIWYDDIQTLNIHVTPPLWRSKLAYIVYVIMILSVLYLIIRFVRLRNAYHIEQLSKEEQERINELKLRFFTNITHEFKTPLTLISGPLEDLIRTEDLRGTFKKKLNGVNRNVQRLSNLVNQLLVFRKLETDHMQLQVAENNIIEFLKEIFLAFQEEANRRRIKYTFECEKAELLVWYDSDKLEKVFFNLLSNALKFSPDYGAISIKIKKLAKEVEIKVHNSGSEIEPELREQVFERFYERNSNNYTTSHGTGIGLSLSKQLIEMHSGKVFLDEYETSGPTFVVELLMGTSHFKKEDFAKDYQSAENVESYQSKTKKILEPDDIIKEEIPNVDQTNERLQLLIIEDNPEVRDYIQSLFADSHEVIIAKDGEEGFEKACSELPDIIISDVMMPKLDGISLCRQLKTTVDTSHIPVILLTARASTSYRIGGLENGADYYLTKPFNSEELKLRVRNVLHARRLLFEKFARTHSFEPKKIAITTTDEKFLNKLMELTEKNIDNSSFTVEQFADELFVSRALLFTKIKALTGQTPKGFVKSVRMKRAAQLLKDKNLYISQIANMTGFSDYRYFTKVFKSHFQVTPKEYSKKYHTTDDGKNGHS